MTIPGKNMIIYVQGDDIRGEIGKNYPIACDRNCSLVIQSDMIETTIKDLGYMRSFLPSMVQYSISGEGLTDFSKTMGVIALQQRILRRDLLNFKFQAKQSDTEALIYSGYGYLRNITMNGPAVGKSTFSYEFIGSGNLNIDNSIPIEGGDGQPTDDMAQVYKLQFTGTDNQTTYQNDALMGAEILGFWIEDHTVFEGGGSDEYDDFNPATGEIGWNYDVYNGMRALILYKK